MQRFQEILPIQKVYVTITLTGHVAMAKRITAFNQNNFNVIHAAMASKTQLCWSCSTHFINQHVKRQRLNGYYGLMDGWMGNAITIFMQISLKPIKVKSHLKLQVFFLLATASN